MFPQQKRQRCFRRLLSGLELQETAGHWTVPRPEAAVGKQVSKSWPVATETTLGASEESPGAMVERVKQSIDFLHEEYEEKININALQGFKGLVFGE